MNYNINKFDKLLTELLSMLRITEHNLNKGVPILMVQRFKGKDKGKIKGKKAWVAPKSDAGALKQKAKVARNDLCFHCGEFGH